MPLNVLIKWIKCAVFGSKLELYAYQSYHYFVQICHFYSLLYIIQIHYECEEYAILTRVIKRIIMRYNDFISKFVTLSFFLLL